MENLRRSNYVKAETTSIVLGTDSRLYFMSQLAGGWSSPVRDLLVFDNVTEAWTLVHDFMSVCDASYTQAPLPMRVQFDYLERTT